MTYKEPTHDELTTIATFKGRRKFGMGELNVMVGIYNRLYNARERATACGKCVARVHAGLMKVLNENSK